MAEVILHAYMLGSFRLEYDGKPVVLQSRRTSRALNLFQYLLYNHDNGASRSELTDVLCAWKDFENPASILTNNIYRLKNMLAESELPPGDYIRYRAGRYVFMPGVTVMLDTERFERAAAKAMAGDDTGLYADACALYGGDFLPEASGEPWVATQSVRLRALFIKTVTEGCALCDKKGKLRAALELCEKALVKCPDEEELHIIKIRTLFELRRFEEASAAFENAKAMLYDMLNLPVPTRLNQLYAGLSHKVSEELTTITDVKGYLEEPDKSRGVYFCNFLAFVDCFRYSVRVAERAQQSVYLMLCQLGARGLFSREAEARRNAASEALDKAIALSMRASDLYTRYSQTQYIVMMQGITLEDCDNVTERITKKYDALYAGRGIHPEFSVLPGMSVDMEGHTLKFAKADVTWD